MSLCDTILSYWSLDEGVGAVRIDSGGIVDLTEEGAIAGAAGLVDGSARLRAHTVALDGYSDAFMSYVGTDAAFQAAYEATASIYFGGWVLFDAHPVDTGVVAGAVTGIASSNYFGFLYDTRFLEISGTGGVQFQVMNAAGTWVTVQTDAYLSDGEWHFLFGWYDETAQTVNLQVDSGTVISAGLGGVMKTSPVTDRIFIGGNTSQSGVIVPNPSNQDAWFYGKGEDVLTEEERDWWYNDGNGRSWPDLVTYCDLPEELSVDLSETLSLIIADPSGLLSDPEAITPPGGSGVPTRFVDTDGGFTDSCDAPDASATVCTRTRRVLPVALAAHLAGTALTLAYCLRLERRDGEVMGFTTHDANLTFGATTYEALNSLEVTALRQEVGGGVGTMDLAGLIRSDRVTAADLLAGRYDGAELTLLLVNWASLGDGSVTLARGWLGAVTLADGGWKAEYRSLAQKFAQEVVEVTSALCRVRQLGDERCAPGGTFGNGNSLADYQFTRTVSAVTNTREMTFAGDSHAAGYYQAGRVVFSSGANDGLEREVKRHTLSAGAAVIELQDGMPFLVEVGDIAMLEAGCDRRLATCKSRFRNVLNFAGEPHVPGFDVLRRLKQANLTG